MVIDYDKINSLDVKKFVKYFNEMYEQMYDGTAPLSASDLEDLMTYGDEFIKSNENHKLDDFFKKLYDTRHDIISSDREVQALALSLYDFSCINF